MHSIHVLLNLSEEEIFLRKGEILGHWEKKDITVEEITTETMLQSEDMWNSQSQIVKYYQRKCS